MSRSKRRSNRISGVGSDLPPSLKLRRTAVALAEAVRSGVRERARCELERNDMATMYYDSDVDIALVRSRSRGARLRIAGTRARAEPEGQRRRRPRRPPRAAAARGSERAAGLTVSLARRGGGLGRRHRRPRAGHESAGALPRCDRTEPSPGKTLRVRARVQHPLRHDSAARRGGRRDDRAEVAGPSRARAVRRRGRHAGAPRGPSDASGRAKALAFHTRAASA